MKSGSGGGGGGGPAPTKRRWKWLVIGVLGLVVLSMLVPLAFLLGLHNRFQSPGFASEQSSVLSTIRGTKRDSYTDRSGESQGDQSRHVDDLVERLTPKGIFKNPTHESQQETVSDDTVRDDFPKKENPMPAQKIPEPPPKIDEKTSTGGFIQKDKLPTPTDESGKRCELKFGSYCLWRREHREDMKDSMVKKLKDQLFVARAYYPTIAKLPKQDKLSREMKQNIQELEKIFSEATTDADLPPQVEKNLRKIQAVIAKAKTFPVECHNVDKKLRQLYDMTEDEANFHMKQSAFLYQLVVQTMPKSLHCLSMRLTVEYFKSPSEDDLSLTEKYEDPGLHHYAVFSTNVLALSVVINSTIMHAKESANQIFHVLTNKQNYYAMKQWFVRNTYKEATVQVINVEDIGVDKHNLEFSLPVEFRVTFHNADRTEYLSTFSHSHFLLPQIFPNLKKVVVLEDDVVVRQDLSALWSLDMGGKVNGAVQVCSVRLNLLKRYLGEKKFDENSCAWMAGLNIIDLDKWRELDLTQRHWKLVDELKIREEQAEAVAFATFLTFRDLIHVLDDSWAVSGLGHDYGLDTNTVRKAAVLHYNGNMKPWLEMGIPKYKQFWRKFRNQDEQFLSDCNVSS